MQHTAVCMVISLHQPTSASNRLKFYADPKADLSVSSALVGRRVPSITVKALGGIPAVSAWRGTLPSACCVYTRRENRWRHANE